MNKRLDLEQAKLWWRSRTPEEKNSGLAPWLETMTPNICITVPIPFCGFIEVFSSSLAGSEKRTVCLSKRALERLRIFYRTANSKGWTMHQVKGGIQFWRYGKIVVWSEPRSGGAF